MTTNTDAVPRPTDDALWDQTIQERDQYHEWADKLAAAIADHFGIDIGEHSNLNNPWLVALDTFASMPQASSCEVQADHIADERNMVAADLYLWLAGDNDNRFIRAWTNNPTEATRLCKAIGLEPTRYYAAPASSAGDQEVGS